MSVAPPATLKKAYTSGNTRTDSKKFLLCVFVAFADLKLVKLAQAAYNSELARAAEYAAYEPNNNLFAFYITAAFIITAIVGICIKDDAIFYKAGNLADFLFRWITKSDFIYKHDEKKTSDGQLDKHVKVKKMLRTGVIWFKKCTSYKRNTCNVGIILVVNPQDVRDLDEYNETTALLLYSLKPGIIQKYHSVQSQLMGSIAEQYEERLKTDDLTPAERVGNYSTKKFLESLSGRVNWAYFIFLGIGYYTDETKAQKDTDKIRKAYELFLNDSGIESRLITSQKEYEIIYKQMYSMKNIGAVTV